MTLMKYCSRSIFQKMMLIKNEVSPNDVLPDEFCIFEIDGKSDQSKQK